jgi:hypothetical protein
MTLATSVDGLEAKLMLRHYMVVPSGHVRCALHTDPERGLARITFSDRRNQPVPRVINRVSNAHPAELNRVAASSPQDLGMASSMAGLPCHMRSAEGTGGGSIRTRSKHRMHLSC